ncbi:MAG: hypothetical protein KC877_01125 [Candidatus Kaiserbacteria bacterium]|nr:hypothetical protein [Candidatus Kaiserbacteria bacterium]MCB9816505.1 hypothetical protein [Candidatus Nomurabacteria bacterium]
MRTFSILFLFLLFGVVAPTHAQFNTNEFGAPASGIDLQPTHPRPGEEVTATLNDYQSSLNTSITWLFDGKVIEEAANKRQTSFIAGENGSQQIIQVVLTDGIGGKRTINSVITPMYLDIILEPQTHVPDFYLGRALPSYGSIVNATALVSEATSQNNNYIYTWQFGNQVLEGGPIRGRNQVSFTIPRDPKTILSVQVSRPDGTVVANRSIFVVQQEPELYFYEVSSLFGVKTTASINSYALIGPSAVLRAEPYFLDSRVYNNPGISEWEVDGRATSGLSGNPYEATIQRTRPTGQASLNFHVRSLEQVLQGVEDGITINF